MHGFVGSQAANMDQSGCALQTRQSQQKSLFTQMIAADTATVQMTCVRIREEVTYRYNALTRIPTILPKVAPTAIDGTKIPAGTLQPYEMTTRQVRSTVARRSEFTIRH